MIAVRLTKIALVLSIGMYCLLIAYNNIVDYGSNFIFVQHVLTMDTTFPDNAVRASRALLDPRLHHIAYLFIIAAEVVIGMICAAGAIHLSQALWKPASLFNDAKSVAILGLAIGLSFGFVVFLVLGGEWFQMWQSQIWNSQDAAFRFIGTIGLILLFVAMEDR